MQQLTQAMLPHLQRRSKLISAEVVAMLTDSQFVELVSADELRVESEMQVVEMLEMRERARGQVPAEACTVGWN